MNGAENGKETAMAPGGTWGDDDGDCNGGGDDDGSEKDGNSGDGREGEPKNTARATARDQLQSN